MTPLACAIEFAIRTHDGFADKGGAPYILHPLRVMDAAFRAGLGDDGMIVAVLHDTLEDTPEDSEVILRSITFGDFSDIALDAVRALTRLAGESYFDYIARCKQNDLARQVKLLDLDDNGAAWRLLQLQPEQAASLAKRYGKARAILMGDAPAPVSEERHAGWVDPSKPCIPREPRHDARVTLSLLQEGGRLVLRQAMVCQDNSVQMIEIPARVAGTPDRGVFIEAILSREGDAP